MDVPQYVRDYFATLAGEWKFSNDAVISYDIGSSAGDGNLGSLISVTIREADRHPMHLLCKLMVEDAETREAMRLGQLFKREVFFYEKVMPAFEQFQRSKGVKGFRGYPKCYGCVFDEDKEQYLIVMEDLRQRQFGMWPKRDPVELEHVKAVIVELAKFHAISFAMKDQQPEIFDQLKHIDDLLIELLKQNTFLGYLKGSHEQILHVLTEYLPQHADKFRQIWANTLPLVNQMLDGKTWEPFAVFLHGDLWNNNTMFQYEEEKNGDERVLKTVDFVDWQFLNYNSPALDLMFYIFSATDKHLRDTHYDELIDCYSSALHDSVRALGSDPDELCPSHTLTQHLKIFGAMTYLTFPSSIDVIFAEDRKQLRIMREEKEKRQTAYEQRVVGFAVDLMKFGYI